jgi:HAD superfamily hydrolase (TIGR01458 family)
MSTVPPAFLFDLDGTLYTNDGPIVGAVETIAELRRHQRPVRFVTNTTRTNRRAIIRRMQSYGFMVHDDELFTPAVAARDVLRQHGVHTVAPFVPAALLEDLAGMELCGGTAGQRCHENPGGVLIGDLGDDWTNELLNEAFRHAMDGATLIALQKGRYFMGTAGLEVDAGAYVAALEYAVGAEALVCGKPSAPFFDAVVGSLGLPSPCTVTERPAMVGDDLWNDVEGAQRAGLAGWLVRTGKFREDVLAESDVVPDRIIDSVHDVI